jgi:hypothetical protein
MFKFFYMVASSHDTTPPPNVSHQSFSPFKTIDSFIYQSVYVYMGGSSR